MRLRLNRFLWGARHSVTAEPVEAQNSSSKIRPLDFGGGGEGVQVAVSVSTLRQAQGTDDRWLPAGHSVSEPVEAQQSPALRQAQGTDSPVAEPVEARPASALRQAQGTKKQRTLADVPPGREVQITGYGELNSSQRQHLQAYGLLPGRRVKVLSQHPVTIVQVEQTELAFERGVAVRVLVGD